MCDILTINYVPFLSGKKEKVRFIGIDTPEVDTEVGKKVKKFTFIDQIFCFIISFLVFVAGFFFLLPNIEVIALSHNLSLIYRNFLH